LTKFAVTVVLDDNVTLQSAVPVHALLQPEKTNPGSAVARNDTVLPAVTVDEQAAPQSIPEVALATLPLPRLDTDRVTTAISNFAVQVLLLYIVTEPSAQSVSPVHPANFEFAAAMGVNVTTRPEE
jgi:hypothetical protein